MGNQQVMYQINGKQFQCPIELSVSILAGRWKTTIICRYIGNLQLAKYLYPDKFQDIEPEQYAKEYFEKWLGVPYQGIWHYSFKDVQ
ncbi:hypothetical protein [Brevibacillus sp. NSP2.1]|uniref:hypothetical protein n=1 Tax=Brevibacillus sp. NSP2.1 TaxID=3003229 RepID=UPI0004108DC7|nr:hypothetical protein [Brevibacillus sp. NSP2.1]